MWRGINPDKGGYAATHFLKIFLEGVKSLEVICV